MYYIYCYTNVVNNHKYVGQTNNLKRRIREHRSSASNPNSPCYNDLFHSKIREYGIDNFEIEVLEQGYEDNYEYINEREQYWIEQKQSYCGTGLGYNRDHGGNNKQHSSILSDEQIKNVKQDLSQNILSFLDIQIKYNISASFLSSINHGTYFFDDKCIYPLRKYYKDDKDYDELIDLLLHSTLSIREIARQLNMGLSTVTKINNGQLRKGLYPNYPIRKIDPRKTRAKQISDLLLNSEYSIMQIAKIIGVSDETVRRINKGETFKDEQFTYPLRNL